MKPGTGRQHKIDDFVKSGEAADALRYASSIAPCSSLHDSDYSELTMRPFFKRMTGELQGVGRPEAKKRSKTAVIRNENAITQQQVSF